MFESVCNILSNYTAIPAGEMKPDSYLVSELGMNSLNMIEAVVALENRFGVEIPDKELFELRTVEDVCILIENLSGK